MKKLLLLPTLFIAIPTLYAMDATPVKKTDGWDGEQYNKHSDPQFKSAMSIIEQIPAPSQPEDWLDLGCGPGRISAELAKKNAQGTVLGVDASESQIAKARQQYKQQTNLFFVVADAQNVSFNRQFKLVVSFTALHWMEEKDAVFKGCYEALEPGGKLVLTMRAKDPEVLLKKAFIATAQEPEWTMLQKINHDQQEFPLDRDELDGYLTQSGFKNIQIWERQFGGRFTPGEFEGYINSLIGGFPSFTQLKAQKPELVNNLVAALVRNYITLSPLGDDGKLEYKLKGWGATAHKLPTFPL